MGLRGAIVVAIAIGAAQYCVLTAPAWSLHASQDDDVRLITYVFAASAVLAVGAALDAANAFGSEDRTSQRSWMLRWTTP